MIRPENRIFFQIAYQTQKIFLSIKRPIKRKLYQNSFWVCVVWLVFLVAFENISCPNPDFIPMSKFSFLKIGPNTKWEIFGSFVKFHKI